MNAPRSVSREELFELYKVAIDEYRFNVELSWNRTRYYLVLSTGILGVGAGLFGSINDRNTLFLLIVLFGIGIVVARLGIASTHKGHEYYRRAAYKKTLIEDHLGLLEPLPNYNREVANLALATTKGMRDSQEILEHSNIYFTRPLRRDSITARLILVLNLFVAAYAIAIYLVLWRFTLMVATSPTFWRLLLH